MWWRALVGGSHTIAPTWRASNLPMRHPAKAARWPAGRPPSRAGSSTYRSAGPEHVCEQVAHTPAGVEKGLRDLARRAAVPPIVAPDRAEGVHRLFHRRKTEHA